MSPDELGSRRHGVNDEVDALARAHTDLEESSGQVGADEHGEVVENQDTDGMLVGMDDVVVRRAVLTRAGEDDWIHAINLS